MTTILDPEDLTPANINKERIHSVESNTAFMPQARNFFVTVL